MAGTKRTPINRPPTGGITREAVVLFDAMRRCNCVCQKRDLRECNGCRRWWELHDQLHAELKLKPWDWPATQNPRSNWVMPEAQERWRQLDQASRELRRQKLTAQRAARAARRAAKSGNGAPDVPAPTP
jgi:hypothetical protein